MKLTKKKIVILILSLPVFAFAVFYFWYAFIFFPNDYGITRQEAALQENSPPSQVIAYSMIDMLDNAQIAGYDKQEVFKLLTVLKDKNYLIKDDPFVKNSRRNLCFRVGTGYPGIWVDERSSVILPDKVTISFSVPLKNSSMLEFSALSFLSGGELKILVSSSSHGQKFEQVFHIDEYLTKYSSKDAAVKWNNIGFEKAKEETGWKDIRIDLGKFTGKNLTVTFSRGSEKEKNGVVFISNPRIFAQAPKRRYNVIYLIFDGVSTRHWSFYNERSKLTPFMKEVADREFTVFDNMFTLGNKTRISTAGLFSSVLPYETRHGINRNFIPETEKENYYKLVRAGKLAALPDVYRKNGYVTEQYGNSGFTVHLLSTGVDYGFDKSYEFSYNPYDSYGLSYNMFKFLRKNKNREFFLYLHYNTPHKPFYAPIKYFIKGFLNAPFESLWRPDFMGCISYTDDVFKNIYSALKNNNLLENTILIVATDHGAGYDLKKFDSGFQYNDYTRMTFMMRLPENLKKILKNGRKRIDTYLSSINTAPTLTELCGLNKVQAFKGHSFSALLNKTYSKKFFDKEIWSLDRKSVSVITDDMYKYIMTMPDGARTVKWEHSFRGNQKEIPYEEIYDLNSDEHETNNLIHEKRDILKKFRTLYSQKDIHHPERTLLSFFPEDKKHVYIEVEISGNSKLIDASLYNKDLDKTDSLNIKSLAGTTRLSFRLEEPMYLTFEHEDDRSPLSVFIKSNNKPLNKKQIYSSYLSLNMYQNPVVLKDKTDFILLNDTRLASKDDIFNKKDLCVKISRIDLHRWIDIGDIESAGISAGMKETLKSWGYIQ